MKAYNLMMHEDFQLFKVQNYLKQVLSNECEYCEFMQAQISIKKGLLLGQRT